MIQPDSPFHPHNDAAYQAWREAKLRGYPQRVEALLVEVADPKSLSAAEHAALLERCRMTNMAIYVGPDLGEDKDITRLMGRQFGLTRLDANLMSDEDDISTLTVAESGEKKGEFIPYTDRPIRWHTDGYYNPPDRQILGMMLQCAAPAPGGGPEDAVCSQDMSRVNAGEAECGIGGEADTLPGNRGRCRQSVIERGPTISGSWGGCGLLY